MHWLQSGCGGVYSLVAGCLRLTTLTVRLERLLVVVAFNKQLLMLRVRSLTASAFDYLATYLVGAVLALHLPVAFSVYPVSFLLPSTRLLLQ